MILQYAKYYHLLIASMDANLHPPMLDCIVQDLVWYQLSKHAVYI